MSLQKETHLSKSDILVAELEAALDGAEGVLTQEDLSSLSILILDEIGVDLFKKETPNSNAGQKL